MSIKTTLFSLCILCLLPYYLTGQPNDNAGSSHMEEPGHIFSEYFPDHHSKKIRGRVYWNPYHTSQKHQFYESKSTRESILFTFGDTVYCPSILYEIYMDRIIVYVEELKRFLVIDGEDIRRFDLLPSGGLKKETFIRGNFGLEKSGMRGPGFYRLLFDGENYSLFKKYYKIRTEKEIEGQFRSEFVQFERFVLSKDTIYSVVKNNRDLLEHFPDDTKTIKQYMRQNGINLRAARDDQARDLIEFINGMSGNKESSTGARL